MKETFRFFGADTVYGERRLLELGETFEADAADVLLPGGIPALPPDRFDAIFTEDDCRTYPFFAMRENAPPEFQAKLAEASKALAELRGV